ncbi:sigma-70 family RNA polymerase sigma factor [Haloactinomyces albus]|uniref:RNA polymerase sigma-70 factor (ECF subfamily) n=1 Tax=Haloactinomyces albus TaxID=1352928 RepID=A0AAE3ZCE7_9ACTN|nr:sigma-70 family RNA polymerase sigma factor [Haloactinomyces albus]MDR7302358.1 RNA polymerase sigma-70 factor (ECF subfamily) [Haloactinomyces albus]
MTAPDTLGPPPVRLSPRHTAARSSGHRPPATTPAVTRTAAQHHEPNIPADTWAHVRAAQGGDSSAFGQLYSQYAPLIYRYVLPRVGDPCLAEDITSETFLRALRRITSVSYQGRDVAAWFITIAKNLVLDHVKSSRNRLEVPTSELIDTSPTARSHELGPEQQVLAEAAHEELLNCVRQLNPDQRECIRLRFLRGLSVTETAEIMQRNEGAIKALQHRAIRRLAHILPHDMG